MSTSKVAATAAASTSGALVLSEAQTGPFENGMAILMNTWPALSMAVENEFGGPDSADKRDWMCGEVANLFRDTPATDAEDLESFMLGILEDEFETNLEDDSAYLTAQKIILLRRQCAADDFSGVQTLQSIWERIGGKNKQRVQVVRQGGDNDQDTDGSDDDMEDADGDVDMETDEAPKLVAVKEKVEKVVDEDGFELVQKKGKRR